jgi:hypothetical protein
MEEKEHLLARSISGSGVGVNATAAVDDASDDNESGIFCSPTPSNNFQVAIS